MENGFGGDAYLTMPGLLFALSMALLILVLPRKYALAPVFALMCYMTLGERLMIGGLNFTMIRILLVFGWIRLICRKEIRSFKFNGIDAALLCWVVSRAVLHNVLWQNGQEFQNSLGGAYDEVGMYFLFRFLVRDINDIKHAIRIFAIFMVPVGILMVNEKLTGHNVFAAFGGVHETTVAREGSLRCQGPFLHPILCGFVSRGRKEPVVRRCRHAGCTGRRGHLRFQRPGIGLHLWNSRPVLVVDAQVHEEAAVGNRVHVVLSAADHEGPGMVSDGEDGRLLRFDRLPPRAVD